MFYLRQFQLGTSILLFLFVMTYSQEAGAKYKLGLNAQAENNHEKAVSLFEESLKSEGETAECYTNLGLSLKFISEKYLNDAHKNYLKALKIDPKHEETIINMGELYLLQGNIIKANSILKQLQKMESGEAEVLQEKLEKMKAQLKMLK